MNTNLYQNEICRGEIIFRRPLVISRDKAVFFLLAFFISIPWINLRLDQLERHYYGVKPGVCLAGQDMSGLLPDEVTQVVKELAIRYHTLPREPALDKASGKVLPGRSGQVIEIKANVRSVLAAEPGQRVGLRLVKIKPRYHDEVLQSATCCRGHYATGMAGDYQRFTNIALACEALNNTVVWPGQVFSFNEVVGPRTSERGYLPAPIILMGGHDIDYGGGVCQAASTAYNAMMESGLRLIERHAHSKPVPYVPDGRDATVGYGYADLRFHNQFDYPVIIKAGMHDGKVEVWIYGREKR